MRFPQLGKPDRFEFIIKSPCRTTGLQKLK